MYAIMIQNSVININTINFFIKSHQIINIVFIIQPICEDSKSQIVSRWWPHCRMWNLNSFCSICWTVLHSFFKLTYLMLLCKKYIPKACDQCSGIHSNVFFNSIHTCYGGKPTKNHCSTTAQQQYNYKPKISCLKSIAWGSFWLDVYKLFRCIDFHYIVPGVRNLW